MTIVLSVQELEFLNRNTPYLPQDREDKNKLTEVSFYREDNGSLVIIVAYEDGVEKLTYEKVA